MKHRAFRLRRDCWTEELLHFNRCVCLTEAELNPLDAAAQEHAQSGQHLASASSSTSSPPFPSPTSTSTAADTIVKETSVSDGTCAEEVALPSERRDAKLHRVKETAPDAVVADTISLSERLNYEDRLDKRSRIDGGEEVAIRRGYFPFRALSVENELTALSKVVRNLQDKMSAFPTTLERDEVRVTFTHTYNFLLDQRDSHCPTFCFRVLLDFEACHDGSSFLARSCTISCGDLRFESTAIIEQPTDALFVCDVILERLKIKWTVRCTEAAHDKSLPHVSSFP